MGVFKYQLLFTLEGYQYDIIELKRNTCQKESYMENILVCVTKQRTCQRLIDYGKAMMQEGDALHIVHVAGSDYTFLGDSEEHRALEFLYEKAREAGAELTVLKSDDAVGTLASIVKDRHVTRVVTGASPGPLVLDSFLNRLKAKLGGSAELIIVPA